MRLDLELSTALQNDQFEPHPTGISSDIPWAKGQIKGKPWEVTFSHPTRDFSHSGELFATASLGLPLDLSILVISRSLKENLEKRAFTTLTSPVQTALDSALPHEMQWLATHQEVGWDSLPWPFFGLFAILTTNTPHPQHWLSNELAERMVEWVDGASFLTADSAFLLTLMCGRVELRMQLEQNDKARFAHATDIFIEAAASAIDSFLPSTEI